MKHQMKDLLSLGLTNLSLKSKNRAPLNISVSSPFLFFLFGSNVCLCCSNRELLLYFLLYSAMNAAASYWVRYAI